MAGSEVAITVESMFSMNRADATTNGRIRENSAMTAAAIAWRSEGYHANIADEIGR